MDENERWQMVCEPSLKRIEEAVKDLHTVVIRGNGKPSLLARMEHMERTIESKQSGQRSRSVELGPIKLNGYAMSDVIKVCILVALIYAIWGLTSDQRERQNLLQRLERLQVSQVTDGEQP